MHPELFRIPVLGHPIKSYGFMLMLGFLTAIWIAMRRAERVKANPDTVLNLGFVSLVCGILGARAFFVVHYWKSQFAVRESPFFEAIKIWEGGMEYYGGLLCAIVGGIVYLRFWGKFHGPGDDLQAKPRRRPSIRLYLDIVSPAVMWGLAFGRMGCFLNGCCFGGLCVDAHNQPALPWALSFPYASPAYIDQFERRLVTAPAELIYVPPGLPAEGQPIPRDLMSITPENRLGPIRKLEELQEELEAARAAEPVDAGQVNELNKRINELKPLVEQHRMRIAPLEHALRHPSRVDPSRAMTLSELQDLAREARTLPVHPAQLYGIINAFLLSLVLTILFYRRKRHGIVFATMLAVYPVTRIILELIRTDNPRDTLGMTISQGVSLAVMAAGIGLIVALYKYLPARSPRAVPFVPPPSDDEETQKS